MARVLGIDPGMTTGYALYNDFTNKYSFWQLDSRSHRATMSFLDGLSPDEIVYEDFKHRPNLMKAELFSVEVIGIIKLYDERREDCDPIVGKFLPTQAKAFWTDEKIKKVGLWQPGQKHAMDALRVLLTYLGHRDAQWYREML